MDLLLVMCPQNSFLSTQGSLYMGEKSEMMRVRLIDYLSSFPKMKVFLREKHAMEDSFFAADKTHSIATTPDYQVHSDLAKYASFSYDKTRYSALFDSELEVFIKQQKCRNVGIIGLETHTSVLFTAEDLRNRGYEVTVVEPLVMSRDDHMHGFAISLMRHFLGVRITNG